MNKLEFVVSSILIFFVFVQGIYPTVFTECLNIPFEVEFFFSALVGIPGGEKGGTNAKILEFLKIKNIENKKLKNKKLKNKNILNFSFLNFLDFYNKQLETKKTDISTEKSNPKDITLIDKPKE
ncbi:MAG: hypothetical protein ACK4F0_08770, partial [Candidatus Ratteibacteria bacterium]